MSSMMVALARIAAVLTWLALSILIATQVSAAWLGITLFVLLGLLAGWLAGRWWVAIVPVLAGIVLAVFSHVTWDPNYIGEDTPEMYDAYIAVLLLPACEIVLLLGVGARKAWLAM
jgi:hypothetical protein